MNVRADRAFIEALPKAELHCHLDGSLRPETVIELASDLPTPRIAARDAAALKEELGLGRRHDSLVEYLRVFDLTTALMQTPQALGRVSRELVEDAAAEGIAHLEVRYAPVQHTAGGLTQTEAHHAIVAALREAGARHDVSVVLTACGMRHHTSESTAQAAVVAALYRDRIPSAYDIAGPEAGFPPSRHTISFDIAARAGLPVTIHAGEADGPVSVWDALRAGGAWRIGHGVRMVEDPALLALVADRRIGVEVCLSSNVQTNAVARIEDHPLPRFLAAGAPCILCTDNRFVSDTTLCREYLLAAETFGLDHASLARLALEGFRQAFLPASVRLERLRRMRTRMAELLASHGVSPDVLYE